MEGGGGGGAADLVSKTRARLQTKANPTRLDLACLGLIHMQISRWPQMKCQHAEMQREHRIANSVGAQRRLSCLLDSPSLSLCGCLPAQWPGNELDKAAPE